MPSMAGDNQGTRQYAFHWGSIVCFMCVLVMRVTKYAYFLFLTLFRCSFICVRDDDSPKRNGDVSGDEEEEEVLIFRE